ncbi:PAS domain S-box protein [uncultured Desulfosarcina sp.]|uniref:PAS domain S-box protein n=1 Tax=uncultured Desulfosarcina sp. TaxID=218289 RepID=UPI0029C6B69C|nr:PAS domain S-box protein [uncultured Desulfosarcina sp.]
MKSPIPLKGYLSLLFGIVAILPIVTIAVLVWFFIMPGAKSRTGSQHQALARTIAGQISTYLEGGERQLTALAEYLQSRQVQPDMAPVRLLDAQCGTGEFFETLFVVDNSETVIQSVGLPISRRASREDFIGLDLSGRKFAEAAKDHTEPVWSQTFLSTVSSRMAVALTIPLADGFIIGEITLDRLSAFIRQLPVESEYLTMVIDSRGQIVADSRNLRWGEVLQASFPLAGGPTGGPSAATKTFELDGERMLGTLVEMDVAGWKVLVAQPIRLAFQPVRDTFALIALGMAVALGLVFSISWLLAGKFSALFTSYARKAESIAKGRYDLQWPTAKTREAAWLGQSLERMADMIKQREKDLVNGEKRLKGLLANVPGVVYQFTANPENPGSYISELVLLSKAAEMFGLDSGPEAYFDDFVACLPAADQPRFITSVREAVEKFKPWYYQGRFIKPSGEALWIEGNSTPRRVGDKIVFYGLLTDITHRKEMEASLYLTQFSFDHAPVAIQRLSADGRILEVNAAAVRMLGYSREELTCMTVLDIDTLATPESGVAFWETVKKRGGLLLETVHRRKDGQEIQVEINSNLFEYEGQEYAIVFIQDITERKRIEASLRITQFSFDNASVGIHRVLRDGRILEVNRQFAQMLGYTKKELETMSIMDIDPAITDETWGSTWQELVARGLIAHESNHRRKDGRLIPVEIYANLLEFEGQQYAIAFAQEITERKQAEKALRENEQLMANILESMNEGVLVLDHEFKYRIVNKKLETLGAARENLLGKRPWEAFPYIKGTDVEKRIRSAMKGNVIENLEIQLPIVSNGCPVWSRDSFSPLKDVNGSVIGVVGVVNDITKQKQNEEELYRLRNYLSNIIDSMPSILVAVDRDGKVTQWNRRAEQVTGILSDKAQTQPLAKVLPGLADEMARIGAAIRERRVISASKVPRKLEQEIRYEDVTIYPLVTNGVEGAVIRVDDATERVRLEEMMIQSEKMLSVGGLAAGMAHEINNPLAGILQNASVLSNRLTGDLPANHDAANVAGTTMTAIRHYLELRKLPDMLENIRKSGDLAATIVKNMLSFARKGDSTISSHDLGSLLDQSLELLKTDYDMKKHYDFKKIEIVREYDDAAVPVPCESSKIQQVFMNILRNGAEAMSEVSGPPIQPMFILRVQNEGDWVRVEIEDNGPGMDEATRRRIFEPFFTTKPVGKGTGLGLSVSYFIIAEDHGGEMRVDAVENGGSRFVLRLPKNGKDGF